VHTDTVYSDTYQRFVGFWTNTLIFSHHTSSYSPETILLLRSLTPIETLYLSRSTNKINEAVGQAFAGGARVPPGANEGVNVARIVVNELDAARFDPLLVKAVARNAASCLGNILNRLDGMVSLSLFCRSPVSWRYSARLLETDRRLLFLGRKLRLSKSRTRIWPTSYTTPGFDCPSSTRSNCLLCSTPSSLVSRLVCVILWCA